jgi:hypothetical protein
VSEEQLARIADTVARVSEVLRRVGPLPLVVPSMVIEFVEANETLIAVEQICTQIYEYDVKVNSETLALIVDLGKDVGLDPDYIDPIRAELLED